MNTSYVKITAAIDEDGNVVDAYRLKRYIVVYSNYVERVLVAIC